MANKDGVEFLHTKNHSFEMEFKNMFLVLKGHTVGHRGRGLGVELQYYRNATLARRSSTLCRSSIVVHHVSVTATKHRLQLSLSAVQNASNLPTFNECALKYTNELWSRVASVTVSSSADGKCGDVAYGKKDMKSTTVTRDRRLLSIGLSVLTPWVCVRWPVGIDDSTFTATTCCTLLNRWLTGVICWFRGVGGSTFTALLLVHDWPIALKKDTYDGTRSLRDN